MSAMTDTAEDDSLAGDRPKKAVPAPSAAKAAVLEAQKHTAALNVPTPSLSPAPQPVTPDSERSHGPLNNLKNHLAPPLNDIHLGPNGGTGTVDSTPPAASMGISTPEFMHEPAFPMAKFRPLPNASAPPGQSLNIPPPSSAPMSRNVSANSLQPTRLVPQPVVSPATPTTTIPTGGVNEVGARANRSQSTSSKTGEKKGFLAKMFNHEPKADRLAPAKAGGDSPPLTPAASDSDMSRPPSRVPSMKRNNKDVEETPVERRPSLLGQRRLSERSMSGSGTAAVSVQAEAPSTSKFTLKDLIGGGKGGDGKLSRRPSDRGSARGSDRGSTKGSERDFGDSASTASLLKKYGVCDRAAIGKGATAVVRLAHKWDRREEKLYAVKEFRKRRKNETEKDYVKKLTSEFCISSTLHHINVVETVDLVQDEQQHWCEVMEYCPGGDLYAAIKKGGMSSGEVECTFKQLLHGIQYLHSMGVAHRDIKPENLLLDGRGHVKITDFGVSDVFRMCWEKKTHLSKGLCGSEPYIAPELFDHKEYDARLVDVWAAAIVFYCMQFQELPWRVAKPTDPTFATYLSQYYPSGARPEGAPACPTPLNNLIPRECRHVIKHMLDPDPKTRWTVDDALKDKWVQSVQVCVEGQQNNHTHTTVAPEIARIA